MNTNQIEPIEQEGKTPLLRTHISNDRRPGNKNNYRRNKNRRQQSRVGSGNVRQFDIPESKFNYRTNLDEWSGATKDLRCHQNTEYGGDHCWKNTGGHWLVDSEGTGRISKPLEDQDQED